MWYDGHNGVSKQQTTAEGGPQNLFPPWIQNNILYILFFDINPPVRTCLLFCNLPKEQKYACLLFTPSNITSSIPNFILYVHTIPFSARYSHLERYCFKLTQLKYTMYVLPPPNPISNRLLFIHMHLELHLHMITPSNPKPRYKPGTPLLPNLQLTRIWTHPANRRGESVEREIWEQQQTGTPDMQSSKWYGKRESQ